jgi:hypothetical protein
MLDPGICEIDNGLRALSGHGQMIDGWCHAQRIMLRVIRREAYPGSQGCWLSLSMATVGEFSAADCVEDFLIAP